MTISPIFIHSLFRAGSTYLFKVFRRSPAGYWCYQEPLHEAVLDAKEEPGKLVQGRGDSLVKELRHPSLELSYFQELVDVWPAWKDALTESAVYDGYFVLPDKEIEYSYLQTLVQAAKGRPVIQECRTPGRIGALKNKLGGTHIYLWRNPWDQWWSYKVTRYFDVVNLLIINSPNAPLPVQLMRDALHIEGWSHHSLIEGFSHYWNRVATSEESYSVFYMLWCLGIQEGSRYADSMLSIDRLTDSLDYRSDMLDRLNSIGIEGIDFSDCRVPQGYYLEQEQSFFRAMEERVHHWLISGGWSKDDINKIQTLCRENQPSSWCASTQNLDPADLIEQASRARELAIRYETTQADRLKKLGEAETRATQAESREAEARTQTQQALEVVQQAQQMAKQAETRATQAESREAEAMLQTQQAEAAARELDAQLAAANQELHAVHQSNHHHWQLAEARQQALQAIYSSWSWRITAPLRWIVTPLMQRDGTSAVPPAPTFIDRTTHWVCMAQPRLLNWGVGYAQKSPRFRRLVLGVLSHMPGLDMKLRQMHIQSQLAPYSHQDSGPISPDRIEAVQPVVSIGSNVLLPQKVPEGINTRQRSPLEAHFHTYGRHE